MRTASLILAGTLVLGASVIARPPAVRHAPAVDLGDAVNVALGLRASTLQPLVMEIPGEGRVRTQVTIAGELRTLELTSHSVRSAAYEVRAQQADGSWVTFEPGPVRTLRGTVPGLPGAAVAGSLLDDGLYASIWLPDGRRYWIEPVAGRVVGVAADMHAVYDQLDVLPGGGSCASTIDEAGGIFLPPGDRQETAGGLQGNDDICVAELACDADVEYYEAHNTVPAVEARINLVINIANRQFEPEVAITHDLTTILVRTAEPDPYTETAAGPLLDEVRDHWNANHTDIERDAVQLFTGKDLDGTIVGLAYVGSLCGQLGYSIVQSDFSGFACSTDLSAHELGHIWGAPHCICESPPYTMNSIITCANRFRPVTQIIIEQFRDRQTCINCQPPIQFSFPLGLPQVLSHEGGTVVQVMVQPGLNEPEPGTTQLHLIINGAPFVSFPMTEVATDVYEATFPAFNCADAIGYFFSVETTDKVVVVVRSPLAAPNESYPALAGRQVLSRFADDFELDQSWTVSDAGLTDGSWERDVPISLIVCDRGNPNGDGDGSGACYLTDNDPDDCDSDVDGGSTTLTSPIMDASGPGIAVLSYARWFDNTGSGVGPNPFEDAMPIEVSDDDGASWSLLETVGPVGAVTGGWVEKLWKLTDVGLAQTDQFRIRFVAQDTGGESTVEAGVDGVELRMVVCCPWDLDGDTVVGINDFLELLALWGTDPAGPPDFDGDGTVGINDFLELLANWGACP